MLGTKLNVYLSASRGKKEDMNPIFRLSVIAI